MPKNIRMLKGLSLGSDFFEKTVKDFKVFQILRITPPLRKFSKNFENTI